MGEAGVSPKQRLAQAKHKIKTWEGEYKATHGCPPDREAMAHAPEDIRHAYKTYRHYRKAVAEQKSSSHGDKRTTGEVVVCGANPCDSNSRVSVSCGDGVVASSHDSAGGGEQVGVGGGQEVVGGEQEVVGGGGEQVGGRQVVVGGVCDSVRVPTNDHEARPGMESKGSVANSSSQTKCSSIAVTPSRAEASAKPTVAPVGVWGRHLNKNFKHTGTNETPKEPSLYSMIGEKLRANSTSKTRKSLSRLSSIKKSRSKSVLPQKTSVCGEGGDAASVCGEGGDASSVCGEGGGVSSVCGEGGDASSESRVSCNSDSTLDKIKGSEDEHSPNSNGAFTTETDEVFDTSFNNTVDDLRPLSVYDAVEAKCNTSFSAIHNTTSQELRPLSEVDREAVEADSCRTLPIHTSTYKPNPIGAVEAECRTPSIHTSTSKPNPISALNTMDLNVFEDIPKFHQVSSKVTTPATQPISALTSLAQTPDFPGVRRRASLNPGWVARCTGTPLEDTMAGKQAVPQDSWKMRLIDKDWSEDVDEEPETPPVEPEDDRVTSTTVNYKPAKPRVRKAAINPRKKTTNNTVTKAAKKKVANSLPKQKKVALPKQKKVANSLPKQKKVLNSLPTQKRAANSLPTQNRDDAALATQNQVDTSLPSPPQGNVGREARTRSTRSAAKPNYTDFSDDEVEEGGGSSFRGGRLKRKTMDDDEPWEDKGEGEEQEDEERTNNFEDEERMSNFAEEEQEGFEPVPIWNTVPVKKRKKETLEEMEETGKIQSQWPPPKKKRIARKKATVGNRAKRVLGKENSPKVKRAVRKRRIVKRKEVEEEEEEEVDNYPATSSQPLVPNLDYNEENSPKSPKVKRAVRKRRIIKHKEVEEEEEEEEVDNPATSSQPLVPNLDYNEENSPKVKKTVRKRTVKRKVVVEEEEEEVDNPSAPSQPSVSNLDYDETVDIESHGSKVTKTRGNYLTGEERMMKKISSGTLNNNFVRINIMKKVFVRGKKNMTGEKYRRQEWKKKQLIKSAEGGNAGAMKNMTCFKCGDFGHWSRRCPGKRGDSLTPVEGYNENESMFLSLDEAASMALGIKKTTDSGKTVTTKMYPKAQGLEKGGENAVNTSYPKPVELKNGGENVVNASNSHEKDPSPESQKNGGENAANTSNSDVKDPSPESQEKPEGVEAEENETISDESLVLPSSINQNVHEGEDGAMSESQNTATEHEGEGEAVRLSQNSDTQNKGKDEAINDSQNTDAQQTSEEAEYEFRDSDDDMFANLEETDNTEERQGEASSTQNTHSTVPPAAPRPFSTYWQERPTVESLYRLSGGDVIPTPAEVHEALGMFGYPSFRPGQEDAIMRILSGQSTLLVLSTGSGKSLCYQLPAYLYSKHRSPCITLCVSPLVSLMEDQVTGLPEFLQAVCLHTHQTPTQRSQAINAIHSRAAHILLVSPEAVVASRTGGVLGTLLKELPPVAFACLDEAHCVSEWSHNFRPSYLRVCQVLRERLGVKTILGLTATARTATAVSIARHLLISDFDTGVIRGTSVPDNLQLSVSRDQHREEALVSLLQGERFSECSSIIIYCTRRDECERVATLIRTQLLDPSRVDVKSNLKRNRGLSFDAEAYHAGLSSYRRRQVQKNFMSGKMRIVVATVAFGMGIDKSDVRGIIHFNMPRNVESYVQEIGRAGRDGEEAHCHLFLDGQDGRDIQELKRHIFANSLDRHTVRKLLNKIFKPCTCAKLKNLSSDGDEITATNMPVSPSGVSNDSGMMSSDASPDPFTVATAPSSCPRHEVAIPIEAVVEELDLPEQNLETLLCYLELHQNNLISINSHVYANCAVSCYGGPRQLVAVSRRCPPLAVAIALERQKGTDFSRSNKVTFPVVEVASRMGWNSKIVKRELKSLEWNTQSLPCGGKVKRSGVMVEMTDLSFHLEARGDLGDDERDRLLDAVYHRSQVQEQDQLRQLHYTYHLLRSVSHSTILFCCDAVDQERCGRLKTELREYFRSNEGLAEVHIEDKGSLKPEVECGIRNSIRAFLATHEDQPWTGRAVARVLHGIASPNYPAQVWGRVRRYWRQHLNTDFNVLVSMATQEILRCK